MHPGHQRQHGQQPDRQQRRRNMVGDQAEQRRHQAGAHIGAGHLHADHGLGTGRAEMLRRGMDDAGVDGRAAQPYQHKPGQGQPLRTGQGQRQDARGDEPQTHADHPGVAEFQRQEAAHRPSGRDAQVEQTGKPRRRAGRHAAAQGQVAAGPQPGGLLHRAVAEKADHDLFGAGNVHHFPQGQRRGPCGVLRRGGSFPQRQREEQ